MCANVNLTSYNAKQEDYEILMRQVIEVYIKNSNANIN